MMDVEKFRQAKALLDDCGAKAVILLANDGTHHSAFVNGLGVDIVQCVMDCMMDNPQFETLITFAAGKFIKLKNGKEGGEK